MIDLGKTPMDIISQILTSCVGTLVYEQGKYKLFAGAATSSVKTFTEDNLRGEVKVRTKPSKKRFIQCCERSVPRFGKSISQFRI